MKSSQIQTENYKSKVIKILEQAPQRKNTDWSEFEMDMIRKYYPTKGAKALSKALGRSVSAIYGKVRNMK